MGAEWTHRQHVVGCTRWPWIAYSVCFGCSRITPHTASDLAHIHFRLDLGFLTLGVTRAGVICSVTMAWLEWSLCAVCAPDQSIQDCATCGTLSRTHAASGMEWMCPWLGIMWSQSSWSGTHVARGARSGHSSTCTESGLWEWSVGSIQPADQSQAIHLAHGPDELDTPALKQWFCTPSKLFLVLAIWPLDIFAAYINDKQSLLATL